MNGNAVTVKLSCQKRKRVATRWSIGQQCSTVPATLQADAAIALSDLEVDPLPASPSPFPSPENMVDIDPPMAWSQCWRAKGFLIVFKVRG